MSEIQREVIEEVQEPRKKEMGGKCARESQAEGVGGRGRQANQDSGQKTEILTADSS